MRKLFSTGLLLVSLVSIFPSHAQAQASFLFGLVIGMSISPDGRTINGGDQNLLYVLPRAAERIKDPLAMQTAASECDTYGRQTIREIFESRVYNPKKKEILQVVRTACGGSTTSVVLWFVFTDKENVTPLEKLPPLPQK